jgi:phosphoglycolate phosphatase-like HAD superfamily hydrolase
MIKSHIKKIIILSIISFTFLQYTNKITSQSFPIKIMKIQETSSAKKAIVFDLGEVLIKTNRTKARCFLGTGALGSYMMIDWKYPDSLRKVLYNILHTENKKAESIILDPYGDIFPVMVCDMLKGIRTESDCHKVAVKIINDSEHLFCSSREFYLCLKSAQILFDADVLTTILEPNKEGLALLQECYKEGHEIFILSNFGKEGYIALKKKYPELFELIKDDHIIISGNVNAAKPESAIYEHLVKIIKKSGIIVSKETVFFIDDQKENIAAALKHNITGIHKQNFKMVKKELLALKLLKNA